MDNISQLMPSGLEIGFYVSEFRMRFKLSSVYYLYLTESYDPYITRLAIKCSHKRIIFFVDESEKTSVSITNFH